MRFQRPLGCANLFTTTPQIFELMFLREPAMANSFLEGAHHTNTRKKMHKTPRQRQIAKTSQPYPTLPYPRVGCPTHCHTLPYPTHYPTLPDPTPTPTQPSHYPTLP
jgi:hypothetical protein